VRSSVITAVVALALLILSRAECRADLVLSAPNTPVVVTFDSTLANVNNGAFTGGGFQPTPSAGQLDSDSWAMTGMSEGTLVFGGTQTTGDFARGPSTGGVTTGGTYGFDVDSSGAVDRALGFQPTGDDWTPGTVTLKTVNLTGLLSLNWSISYDIYVLNDQGRSNSFNFSYSLDGLSFTPIVDLDFTSPTTPDASPSFVQVPRSTLISASVASGDNFYLRWSSNDVGGANSRDEFALDNISIALAAVPEASAFVFGCTICVLGVAFRARSRRGVVVAG